MADLFADALMLWIKTVMVAALLFGLCLVVMGVIAVVERAHEKAMAKKKKEVDSDDV